MISRVIVVYDGVSRCLIGLFDEMHVLDDSALPVVLQFVLNSLLLHEALPVELALPHRVDLSRSIIDGAHNVV